MITRKGLSFWVWFFKGDGGKSGLRRLILDWWILAHVAIGLVIAFFNPLCLEQSATVVLLPLMGILIALAFAWSGNAHALLNSEEIVELAKYHEGGFKEYVFVYQTAILVILITLIVWAFAGLGFFDRVSPTRSNIGFYFAVTAAIYFLTSLTLRECWQVVLGTQQMLIIQTYLKSRKNKEDKDSSQSEN